MNELNVSTCRVDRRAFLHKRLAKFAGGLVRTGLNVAGGLGIPGISAGARFASSLTRGGSRDPAFNRALGRSRGRQNFRIPDALIPTGPGGVIGLLPGVPGGVSGFAAADVGGTCPKGFHLNKSNYHLKDGTLVPEMSRCVRNRRRNADNGRANMRAARRLLGRRRSNETIDKALRSLAPARRSSPKKAQPRGGGTTVVAT